MIGNLTNSAKLRGKIAEKGFNISSLSRALHMSRACLRNKINGLTEFKGSEIKAICSVLDISIAEMSIYFFTSDVAKMETQEQGVS